MSACDRIRSYTSRDDHVHNQLSVSTALHLTCALLAPQAWIMNATVKENILLGKPYNDSRLVNQLYDAFLRAIQTNL